LKSKEDDSKSRSKNKAIHSSNPYDFAISFGKQETSESLESKK
jgi:hypothetical protein